jgi:hypothetical protein
MTTTAPTTTPRPRRRRLQFSLRTLLVVVCGAGMLGDERQARAVMSASPQ